MRQVKGDGDDKSGRNLIIGVRVRQTRGVGGEGERRGVVGMKGRGVTAR